MTAVGADVDEQIRRQFDTQLSLIEAGVDALRPVIEKWNRKISEHALDAVRKHRQHLKIVEELPERLQIPLIVREGRADYRPIEIRPRRAEPAKSTAAKDETQYFIGHPQYEMILNVIRHFGRSFEISPKPFQGLREPEIRDSFVAALNVYFRGKATAEQFRRHGKADITIEEESRAAFISEFKIWNGERSVHEALDQILDYTTWRDAKCAVVLFNRKTNDFLRVLNGVAAHLAAYPFLRGRVQNIDRGEWRIVIAPRGAPRHQITVQVFVFDIRNRPPTAKQH